jgi:hypothetical protein
LKPEIRMSEQQGVGVIYTRLASVTTEVWPTAKPDEWRVKMVR